MAAASPSAIGTDYPEYGSSSHKWLIALAVMLGTTLEVLDTSIVNVALPHMQGSFSASVDESNAANHAPGAHGFDYAQQILTGHKQGLGMVYGMIQRQAAMLSFNDIYRTLAIGMIILIPSFLLLRRPQTTTTPAAH